MAAPGAALAVTASEIRPAGTTPSGKRHPITGIAILAFDIADGRKAFDATVLRKPAKPGAKTKGMLDPEPGAAKLRAAIDGRTLICWRVQQLEPLRPILAPNSRHTRLGEEAQTRVTNWRSDLDVRIGHLRVATDPGRPDRLALLIRRIAAGAPDGTRAARPGRKRPVTMYMDDLGYPARVGGLNAHWSHLIADDIAEPHAFAARLGLRRQWFQDPPRPASRWRPRAPGPPKLALRRHCIQARPGHPAGRRPIPYRDLPAIIDARFNARREQGQERSA